MKFKPFKMGDIVEHVGYEGGFFEIVEVLPTEFGNRTFFRLKLWNSPSFLSPGAARRWRKDRSKEDTTVEVESRKLRQPFNAMEVIAIAWAKAQAE